jgi:hypothetical protein
VTWCYAKQTGKIVDETRNTVNEKKRATELQFIPSLIIMPFSSSGPSDNITYTTNGELSLYIKNIVVGPVKQIRVQISIVGSMFLE